MRLTNIAAALVLLCGEAAFAHRHLHRRHVHSHSPKRAQPSPEVEKREATCSLPDHSDLVHVPGAQNNGFAMSPDQPCKDGMYCPIACKPGMVMAQWEPGSTYNYPSSMNGGLYCNGGKAEKPFDSKPYCVDGTGSVQVVNECGKKLSFCQTVLPGNEAMLIPTIIDGTATLAVPGTDYWGSTAAHYYINPPGVGDEGCIWGDNSQPIGNWAPYVAGANADKNGQTFLKLGWNPIFEFEGAGLEKKPLKFGVRVECPSGGCNGLPCEIDPSKHKLGEVGSKLATEGAGGSSFCVVTVPSGSKANIVVFSTDGSGGDYEEEVPEPSAADDKPTSSAPTETSEPSSKGADSASQSTPTQTRPTVRPGIFQEKETSTTDTAPSATGTSDSPRESEQSNPSDSEPNVAPGRQSSAAFAGLVIAVAAAACLF
ncbi:related to UTH1 protein [Cephalotrichum gorgonifer]|uniref:Related to UTH1 protein n=1 Tax=Cephalotrichum gorgonifer TaxID=2041049 RepID=A0AAE8N421_9PEZI|nr:related to UTH1 protein [Cephalotrichum gorgonifer]